MKLKFLLISLALSVATVNAGATKKTVQAASTEKTSKSETTSPAVSDHQVESMRRIMEEIVHAHNVNSPEELFKMIDGQTQTTDREQPAQGAITAATEERMRIICYQEGSDVVVASSDPTLISKPVTDFKTEEGITVRDLAIQQIAQNKSEKDPAIFTYKEKSSGNEPLVNGKPVVHPRVVIAYGRKAFNFNSEKKLICTGGEVIKAG
jgi:predicted extracellular nuclease